ncbi:MAG: asparaginase [Calditrichaeota bacterium]|nr:asparaginase [Calditrichota bacterium]
MSKDLENIWVPLVDYRRNGVPERTIHGSISWFSPGDLQYSYGGDVKVYGRSVLKPYQMKVIAETLDPVLNWEQKAISLASHIGDREHTDAVRGILTEDELGIMQTPHALPLIQFGRQIRRPRRIYHCCSGKHAAILKACKLLGWSRVGYTWPHHPYNIAFLNNLKRVLGQSWEPEEVAKDGCGLPTFSMTVNHLAHLFQNLCAEKDQDWIWEAMIQKPDLIGGFNRLDSTILKTCNGQVIAKEGADGLLGLAIIHPDFPKGIGIMLKIAHGWDPQAMWYVARYVLGVLGFKLRNPYHLERQKAFIKEDIIPPQLRDKINTIKPFDDWDVDMDRWYFDFRQYVREQPELNQQKQQLHS